MAVSGVCVSGCHAKAPKVPLALVAVGPRGDRHRMLLALLPRAPHPCPRRDAPNAGSGFWTTLAGLSPGSSRPWLEELITAVVLSSAKLSLSPGWQTASAVWSPTVGPSPLEHPCQDGAGKAQIHSLGGSSAGILLGG